MRRRSAARKRGSVALGKRSALFKIFTMFFAPCFWSSAPLILLTSLVMLALPPQVEETEVEEGKWKEGARGAPRLVAMIPVQS